jgi:hypothetical protein
MIWERFFGTCGGEALSFCIVLVEKLSIIASQDDYFTETHRTTLE